MTDAQHIHRQFLALELGRALVRFRPQAGGVEPSPAGEHAEEEVGGEEVGEVEADLHVLEVLREEGGATGSLVEASKGCRHQPGFNRHLRARLLARYAARGPFRRWSRERGHD